MTDRWRIRAAAKEWLAVDPDPETRAELARLLDITSLEDDTDEEAYEFAENTWIDLYTLFHDRLTFGTAGLRGPLGPGPFCMNRVMVRWATAGVMLMMAPRGQVVVAHDARRNSDVFAADAAAVVAGKGGAAVTLGQVPTPVAAHAVVDRQAAAGIVITASHNPPNDNGYKLYDARGIQIVDPDDGHVEESMRTSLLPPMQLPEPSSYALAGRGAVYHAGPQAVERYLQAITRRLRIPEGPDAEAPAGRGLTAGDLPPLRIVYTPLHGVGAAVLGELFERLGLPVPVVVPSQAEPDGTFPTVEFPNPEVPGALDEAYDLAGEVGADLVIANDPDADRLAVAVPVAGETTGGPPGWYRLTGDELGALLGDYLLRRRAAGRLADSDGSTKFRESHAPDDPSRSHGPDSSDGPRDPVLMSASVVSSQMLRAVAADAGVPYVETLTGFKWIARAAEDRPERLLFGYEEALGYAVCDEVRDKDGISAAALAVQLVQDLRAEGSSLLGRLYELELRHGVHVTRQVTVDFGHGFTPPGPVIATRRIRETPLARIAGHEIVSTVDYLKPERPVLGLPTPDPPASCPPDMPSTDMLVFRLATGDRAIVRPSGTEPKLKVYVEAIEHAKGAGDLDQDVGQAARQDLGQVTGQVKGHGPDSDQDRPDESTLEEARARAVERADTIAEAMRQLVFEVAPVTRYWSAATE